jgi:hypothetical protein
VVLALLAVLAGALVVTATLEVVEGLVVVVAGQTVLGE